MSNPNDVSMVGFEVSLPKPSQRLVSVNKLVINDSENIRHAKGVDGVDTYQLSEMMDAIKLVGHIREAIVVEEIGKELHVRRGFRRSKAAQLIVQDQTIAKELYDAMQKIPAIVYQGPLTDLQRLVLINDQDNKRFMFSELVTLIFKYFGQGLKWNQVAFAVYRQWAEATGKRDILNEVDTIQGDEAKRARINKWLQGSFQKVFGAAYNISPMCVTAIKREALEKDKLIKTIRNTPKTTDQSGIVEGPYVYLMGQQSRLTALATAKLVDEGNNNWTIDQGGPEFKTLWEKFHAEDYLGTKLPPPPKSLSYSDLNELSVKIAQSKAVKAAFEHASGKPSIQWSEMDRKVAGLESRELKWLKVRELFPKDSPYLRALDLVFVHDIDTFNLWLEENVPV